MNTDKDRSGSFQRPVPRQKTEAPQRQAPSTPILRSQREEVETGVEDAKASERSVPKPVRREEARVSSFSRPIPRSQREDNLPNDRTPRVITPETKERWLWGIFLKGDVSQEDLLRAIWEYDHAFNAKPRGKHERIVLLVGAITPHINNGEEWIALRGESERGEVLRASVDYAVSCLKASLPGKILEVESYAGRWDLSLSDFNTDEGYRRGLDAAPYVIKALGALADVEMPFREFCSNLGIEPLRFWERDIAVTRNDTGKSATGTLERVTRLERNTSVQVDLKEVSPEVVLRNLYKLLPEVEDYDHEMNKHRRFVCFYAGDRFYSVKFYSDKQSFAEAFKATERAMG